jgi:hypothetical protein
MLTDLERVRAELDVVVDQSEDGREGPDDAPDSDVSELCDHLGVVGCLSASPVTRSSSRSSQKAR